MVVFYFDAKWRGTKEIVVLSFRVFWKKVAEERITSLCSLDI
jgi:hypothetical protein